MESLPNDILDIIKDFIIFKPKTRNELQKAVDLWCINKNKTLQKYGHISIWDTSLITDMCGLFYDEPDSPYWEYSVTTFNNRNDNNSHTDSDNNSDNDSDSDNNSDNDSDSYQERVNYKENFNDNINDWDVSNVTHMCGMFVNCKKFNQPLNKWNVSKVQDMELMFKNCKKFNQPLNNWITSNVLQWRICFKAVKNLIKT